MGPKVTPRGFLKNAKEPITARSIRTTQGALQLPGKEGTSLGVEALEPSAFCPPTTVLRTQSILAKSRIRPDSASQSGVAPQKCPLAFQRSRLGTSSHLNRGCDGPAFPTKHSTLLPRAAPLKTGERVVGTLSPSLLGHRIRVGLLSPTRARSACWEN